jgi:hypothetical protein
MQTNTTAKNAAPILTDAAVIDLWRLGAELGTVTREEALAHLATLGLSMDAFAEGLEGMGVRVGADRSGAHLAGVAQLELDRLAAAEPLDPEFFEVVGGADHAPAIRGVMALVIALDRI